MAFFQINFVDDITQMCYNTKTEHILIENSTFTNNSCEFAYAVCKKAG